MVGITTLNLFYCTCGGDDVAPDSPGLEHAEEDAEKPVDKDLRADSLDFRDVGSHLRQIHALGRPHWSSSQPCKLLGMSDNDNNLITPFSESLGSFI